MGINFYATSRRKFRRAYRDRKIVATTHSRIYVRYDIHDIHDIYVIHGFHLWKYGTFPRTSWFTTFLGTRA